MFKMMKYEYKRAMGPLMIVFSILAFVELYFLIATSMKKEAHSGIATSLFFILSFACYLFVLVYGILTYNKDLKNKEGYLVFMAPISSFKVIGAKLLSTLLTGVTLVGMLFALGAIDYSYAAKVYHFDGLIDFLKLLFSGFGMDVGSLVASIFLFIFIFLVQFFMTTTLGYLAISLSATVLQNKKIKGFISFALFVVLYGTVNAIAAMLPNMRNLRVIAENGNFLDQLVHMMPQIGLYAAVMVICYIVSSLLLEKKISL